MAGVPARLCSMDGGQGDPLYVQRGEWQQYLDALRGHLRRANFYAHPLELSEQLAKATGPTSGRRLLLFMGRIDDATVR